MRTLIIAAGLTLAALPALAQTGGPQASPAAQAQPALQPTVETAVLDGKGE